MKIREKSFLCSVSFWVVTRETPAAASMAALLSFSSVHTAATASTKVSMEALTSSTKGCPQTCLAFQWRPCCPQMHSRSLVCRAEENDRVEVARKMQMSSTDLLAQLMKAENTELFAREHAESLTQEFFMIASTYLSMAKKEGNAEVVNHLESTLKIAMQEREKILRPEIQLLNQLLRDLGASERAKTMDKFLDYLKSDSYFFQLLNRMILDVEKQPTSRNNPEQMKLLAQLRAINKEARDVSKGLKHAARDKK